MAYKMNQLDWGYIGSQANAGNWSRAGGVKTGQVFQGDTGQPDSWPVSGVKRLSNDREWKTYWKQVSGLGDRPGTYSGGLGGDSENRYQYSTDAGVHGQRYNWGSGKHPPGSTLNYAQTLDWEAYDKDVEYKKWLESQGRDKFKTLQDIYDAEEWMAQGSGGTPFDPSDLEASIQSNIGRLDSLTTDVGSRVLQSDYDRLTGQLDTRLGDLESRNFHVGDIAGLDEQLRGIVEQTGTGDQQLTDLINRYRDAGQEETDAIRQDLGNYLTTAGYEESMANRLGSLQDTMRDEFGRDIAALNIDQVRDDIRAQGGDLSALTRDFAGLSRDVGTMDARLGSAAELNEAQREILRQKISAGEALSAQERQQLRGNIASIRGDVAGLADLSAEERTKLGGQIDTLAASTAEERDQIRQDLRDQYTTLRGERGTELSQLEDKLVADYSDKLLSLESGFDTDLEGVRDILGQDVARLTGQDEALSGRIEDVRGALGDYRTEAAGRFGDITQAYTQAVGDVRSDLTSAIGGVTTDLSSQIGRAREESAEALSGVRSDLTSALSGVTTDLSSQIGRAREEGAKAVGDVRTDLTSQINQAKTEGAEAIQDVYASRAEQLGRIQSDWGENLRAQEDLLTGRIDRGEEALNERLSQLSASMNYRLLGDSALGIRSRRSDAYRSGDVRQGTGQLSRGMRINTLNIA